MTERNAKIVAEILGGRAVDTGGQVWLVRIKGNSGTLVFLSEAGVSEYEDQDAFDAGDELTTIEFE